MLDNALAAGGSVDDLIEVDPDLYRAVSPADRPGENDYEGYDIAALALDLVTAWEDELVRRARAAVNHNQLSAANPQNHVDPGTA